MSSWAHDWERALIPKVNGVRAKVRTQCKIGRHLILEDASAVWLRGAGVPMGLSCTECAQSAAPDLVAAEKTRAVAIRAAVKVPVQRDPSELTHGKASTYIKYKCRCEPCRLANNKHSADYKRARRARERAARESGGQS